MKQFSRQTHKTNIYKVIAYKKLSLETPYYMFTFRLHGMLRLHQQGYENYEKNEYCFFDSHRWFCWEKIGKKRYFIRVARKMHS